MQAGRLYLTDSYIREFEATVVDSDHGWCTLSQTTFYPGGGGQPPDGGSLIWNDERLAVRGVRDDGAGRVWHDIGRDLPSAAHVRGTIDWAIRYACMRSHGLLHVVNAVARRRFGGLRDAGFFVFRGGPLRTGPPPGGVARMATSTASSSATTRTGSCAWYTSGVAREGWLVATFPQLVDRFGLI